MSEPPGAGAAPSAGHPPGAGATDAAARIGHPRVHLRRTDSTNERARALALAGAPHGTLVTASEQTAGRGRQGRSWSAPAGQALLMSLLLRSPPSLLPLIAAVAVCDVAGERFKIKWPNDVVVELDDPEAPPGSGRNARLAKLAGILVEARIQEGWAVLGIGVNVAVRLDDLPKELRGGVSGAMSAASLERAPADVEPTLAALLAALERRLSEPDGATLEAWRARDALHGHTIAWAGGSGRAEGIDGTGRLVVALDDGGRTALGAGEVHLLGVGQRHRVR
ncbi:MAG TPA: biotin--[acetyl-CoA-carboxylase] ligase [Solirubrobacteraceae bacterium]|nr:biotin--[acetyl-CoA-carboxylase] ligase [Solirubrobacteraceae bacterium]